MTQEISTTPLTIHPRTTAALSIPSSPFCLILSYDQGEERAARVIVEHEIGDEWFAEASPCYTRRRKKYARRKAHVLTIKRYLHRTGRYVIQLMSTGRRIRLRVNASARSRGTFGALSYSVLPMP